MKKTLSICTTAIKKCLCTFFTAFPFFFCLIAYEILYFIMMPYHKGMITLWFTGSGGDLWGENIIRVLYYGIYCLILCGIALYINKRDFDFVERNSIIPIILKLLVFRCAIDILNCMFISITNIIWQSFYDLLLEIVFVTVTFNYISKKLNMHKISAKLQNIALLPIFTVSFILYLCLYLEYNNNRKKYNPDGCAYLSYIDNLDFRLQMYQLLLMSLWLVLYICAVYYLANKAHNENEKCIDEKENLGRFLRIRKKSVQIVRIYLIIVAVVLVSIGKMIIYPVNSLILFPSMNSISSSSNYYEENISEIILYRNGDFVNSTRENDTSVYSINKCAVYYNGKKFVSFTSDCYDTSITPEWLAKRYSDIDLYYMKRHNYTEKLLFQYYSNDILLYFEDEQPRFVFIEDIRKRSESEMLTYALETLISKGYWDYFEFGCEYLLNYDSAFIMPYINRYACENFTDIELEQNTHINKQYMVDFAKRIKEESLK